MSVLELHRKVRIVRRYQQILNVLVKHGFGYVLDKLGLEEYISTGKRLVGLETRPPKAREPLPVKLRHVMEELGPTFIKMGQILSMRPDLLPPNFLNEFKKLQDHSRQTFSKNFLKQHGPALPWLRFMMPFCRTAAKW